MPNCRIEFLKGLPHLICSFGQQNVQMNLASSLTVISQETVSLDCFTLELSSLFPYYFDPKHAPIQQLPDTIMLLLHGSCKVWHYRFWSFKTRDRKLERWKNGIIKFKNSDFCKLLRLPISPILKIQYFPLGKLIFMKKPFLFCIPGPETP